jgi:hypothetical protein
MKRIYKRQLDVDRYPRTGNDYFFYSFIGVHGLLCYIPLHMAEKVSAYYVERGVYIVSFVWFSIDLGS